MPPLSPIPSFRGVPSRLVAPSRAARSLLAASLLAAGSWSSSAAALSLEIEPVLSSGQGDVVAITNAGDDRLFLVSKEGRVFILRDGIRESRPYLDLRSRVLYTGEPESEQGLLSVVFHPDYASNGFLFAAYTGLDGTGVLARFSVSGPDPDVASVGSERILLEVPQPGPNHNINHLAFGPDGYLYVSSGDGGYQPEPRCTPQDRDNFLGKVLRLDVDTSPEAPPYYAIPADNPFVGDPATLDEIWGLGLRNPWRFAFDPTNGDLWLADVGHRARDEINFVAAGSPGGDNWGFKMMEGFACRGNPTGCRPDVPPCFSPEYTEPVLDQMLDSRHCAVIAGPVYGGTAIPELRGALLVGDYCGATSLVRRVGPDVVRTELSEDLFGLTTFGEDSTGEVYLRAGDTLYRLVGLREDVVVGFDAAEISVDETAGFVRVPIRRQGDAGPAVSVTVGTRPLTAGPGDFTPISENVAWPAGATADRFVDVSIVDDAEREGDERFVVELTSPVGADLAAQSTVEVRIVDDEIGGVCVPSPTVLCLGEGGRFRTTLTWRDFEGGVGVARAVSLDGVVEDAAAVSSSGLMWFFRPDNMEMLVKVLDGCAINDHHWVLLAAATTVDYTIEILDTETGGLWRFRNPLGNESPAVTDIDAFACD